MSSKDQRNSRFPKDFLRAARFLGGHRRQVMISIICGTLTGLVMTSGIPAIVPFIKIFTEEGQTIKGWVDEMVAKVTESGSEVPFYLQWLQQLASYMPTDPVKAVTVLFLAIATLAIIGNIIRYIYEYAAGKATIGAVNDIRYALYDHVLHMPMSFFGTKGTSDVTSRLISDSNLLFEGFKILLGQALLDGIRGVLALTVAMLIDWRLTLFIMFFIPLAAFVIGTIGRKMRRASRRAMQESASMLGQVEGSLAGIRVVKSYGAERFERRHFSRILDALRRQQTRMARYDAMSTPTLETLGMWGTGAVLIFATYLMFSPSIPEADRLPPEWAAGLVVALLTIGESIRKLSKLNNVIQRSDAAAARIFEAIDLTIERRQGARTVLSNGSPQIVLPELTRQVAFESVTFTYPGGSSPAVSSVDLVVPRGKSVAIVGRNGSGKTTLMALLPRFYDPDSGRVTIDGVDIRNVTLRSLRRQIGVVTQDSVVFPGTVAQNIAYGHPLAMRLHQKGPAIQALRAQIESAARQAFAHDFIMEKAGGYDASLEGLGGQLSGGQKQRLNIARAMLRQSPILILDEATSQVDAESEHLIQQAIESLMHERTTFVIAHRLNTVLSADSIVVMDRGRIVGQGQHEQLLKTCEPYQQLYERQLVGAGA